MKLVIKIADFFKNSTKNLEKIITSKKGLLIISLLIAFLAFYKLDRDSSIMMNNYAERINNEPVRQCSVLIMVLFLQCNYLRRGTKSISSEQSLK